MQPTGESVTRFGDLGVPEPLFIAESPATKEVKALAARAATGDAKVLITGESGSGKDVVARYVHTRSHRCHRDFVAVNCAAFSETLLESELFGHVRGSFTGAHRDKPGKLQKAHLGTIFLDEVAEMSLHMQASLLRFLDTGEIQPVGADESSRRVDVRVIAATNRDLGPLIAAGEFREDLLYRIRVIHLQVPPLRARREDIRPLVEHMVRHGGGRQICFAPDAMDAIEGYRWPGNIRQLQNMVEQLTWMSPTEEVNLADLPSALRTQAGGSFLQTKERRRQVADELFDGLVNGDFSFWDHTYVLFMGRDVTRHDIRELVRRGLAATSGNFRALVKLFRMPPEDYKRFLNFLASHDCGVDFRSFRAGTEHTPAPPPRPTTKGDRTATTGSDPPSDSTHPTMPERTRSRARAAAGRSPVAVAPGGDGSSDRR